LKGHVLFQARRYSDAVAFLQKNLELDDNFWITHIELGKNYESTGQFEPAMTSFRRAQALSGGISEVNSLIGYTYAVSGHRAEAEKVLADLSAMANQTYVPPYNLALLYHGLGDSRETARWLERAKEEKDVHMVFLGVDPKWDDVRTERWFASLMKAMNFAGAEETYLKTR
jgi:Flp pilus assembly protein TadD